MKNTILSILFVLSASVAAAVELECAEAQLDSDVANVLRQVGAECFATSYSPRYIGADRQSVSYYLRCSDPHPARAVVYLLYYVQGDKCELINRPRLKRSE